MTVLEAIQKSTEFLAKKGIESPRLQTELLLAHLLKMPRMKLYLNFDRALTTAETDALRDFVKRRSVHEPLQHITGSTSFLGFEIKVNRNALVPRPETELLAGEACRFLSSLNTQPSTALDFGTGTGCIAIAIAAKCPNARVTALDVSSDALALAKENVTANNVSDRVEFLSGNGFAAFAEPRQFDLIVSNPPYIPTAEIETLQPEVRDFDPRGALDGGPDGLDFYRMFASQAKAFLKAHGRIMLEFGDGQAAAIREIFGNEKWIVEAVKEDYSQRERILVAALNH